MIINASTDFERHPDVRKLNWLSDENINKIADAYHKWTEKDGFSRIVKLDEIRKNDYNLNVTLYVYPEDDTEDIDIMKEWSELKELEGKEKEVDKKIEGHLKEIG